MKRHINEIAIFSIPALAVMALLGLSMALQSFTIVDWWKPAACCGILSLPMAFLIGKPIRRLTQSHMRNIEYPIAYILSFSVLLSAFYWVNFHFPHTDTAHEYSAPVVRKYTQERTRQHKTGRRNYREEKYSVFIVELKMEDGTIKKQEKSLREYNRIKTGSHVRILIEEGFFNVPVFRQIKNEPTNNNQQ